MPKIEIDYSNTIIYKITCKDSNVKDVYVGHTTNFVQRKHAHKQSCINDKSPNYNCKLYDVIRNNGGWNNWKIEIINFFNCHDHYEARKKEQEYFVSLNATLNSIEPMPKPKIKLIVVKEIKEKQIFYCETCNIYCANSNLLESHNNTKKHKKLSIKKMEDEQVSSIFSNEKCAENMKNIPIDYYCEKCQYKCCKLFCWKQHLNTSKHQNATESYIVATSKYVCACEKQFKHHSSFYRHKKCCIKHLNNEEEPIEEPKDIIINKNEISPELIMSVLQQNKELQTMLMEQNKTIMELSKNNTITNNNKILKKLVKEVTIDKS